ncbi:hypothetical protein HMPREF0971_03350 [Segatella oris F0302]|uniref:Uncharacterized protein n=1 Tax=Segatella oris F0302 TaxID=649760 RepID=D1QWF3_9BACT|nr:hypothetical protein HMPREF0971_03350 [Segatella oris F0302]
MSIQTTASFFRLIPHDYGSLSCEGCLSFFCSVLSGVPLHILLYVFASETVVRCQR